MPLTPRILTADRGDDGLRLDLVLRRHLTGSVAARRARASSRGLKQGLVTVNGAAVRRVSSRAALGDIVAIAAARGVAAGGDGGRRRRRRRAVRRRSAARDRQAGRPRRPPDLQAHRGDADERAAVARARLAGAAAAVAGQPARQADVRRHRRRQDGGGARRAAARDGGATTRRRTIWRSSTDASTWRAATSICGSRRDRGDRRKVVASKTDGRREPDAIRAAGARGGAARRAVAAPLPARDRTNASDPRAPGGARLADGRRSRRTASRAGPQIDDPLLAATLRAFPRQALHAWRVGFTHPITRARISDRSAGAARPRRRCWIAGLAARTGAVQARDDLQPRDSRGRALLHVADRSDRAALGRRRFRWRWCVGLAIWHAVRSGDWGMKPRGVRAGAVAVSGADADRGAAASRSPASQLGTWHDRSQTAGRQSGAADSVGTRSAVRAPDGVPARGAIGRGAHRRASCLAAALFAALHLPNPFLTAMTFAGALAWCWIYDRASQPAAARAVARAADARDSVRLRRSDDRSPARGRGVSQAAITIRPKPATAGPTGTGIAWPPCAVVSGFSRTHGGDPTDIRCSGRSATDSRSRRTATRRRSGRPPAVLRRAAARRSRLTIAVHSAALSRSKRAAHESLSANAGNRGDSPQAHAGSVDAGLRPSRCRCICRCARAVLASLRLGLVVERPVAGFPVVDAAAGELRQHVDHRAAGGGDQKRERA